MNSRKFGLLMDVGVGTLVAQSLIDDGYDVARIEEINCRMTDEDILQLAVKQNRLIITMDTDFGELVWHSKKHHTGVLLLRMEDATGKEKARIVQAIFKQYSSKLAGCFSVYRNNKLRIRQSVQ